MDGCMALCSLLQYHDKLTALQQFEGMMSSFSAEPFRDTERLEALEERLDNIAYGLGMDADADVYAEDVSSDGLNVVGLKVCFLLGFLTAAVALCCVVCIIPAHNGGDTQETFAAAAPGFRLMFIINLAIWLAAGCVRVFEKYDISYSFLMRIGPENQVSSLGLLHLATVQSSIWTAVCLMFIADVKLKSFFLNGTMAQLLPTTVESTLLQGALAHGYMVALLAMQALGILSFTTRRSLLQLSNTVASAIFLKHVTFTDVFIVDFLTSVARVLDDISYTWCYLEWRRALPSADLLSVCSWRPWYIHLLLVAPFLLRMLQCGQRIRDTGHWRPHILNCLKYATSASVSILCAAQLTRFGLTPRQSLWIQISGQVITMVFSLVWDVVVDFDLLAGTRSYLYPRSYYGAVAFCNTLLRATWSLKYFAVVQAFVSKSSLNAQLFTCVICMLDLLRRALWAVIRLETEHRSNAARFPSACLVPTSQTVCGKSRSRINITTAITENRKDGAMAISSSLEKLLKPVNNALVLFYESGIRFTQQAKAYACSLSEAIFFTPVQAIKFAKNPTLHQLIAAEDHPEALAAVAVGSTTALCLGSAGAVAGSAIGCSLGTLVGLVPALFTFGMSIPAGAAVGLFGGFTIGTAAGGSAGFIGGAATSYAFARRQHVICTVVNRVWIQAKDRCSTSMYEFFAKVNWTAICDRSRTPFEHAYAKTKDALIDKRLRMAAVCASTGAAAMGTAGAAGGTAVGAVAGAMLGIVPAFFTFGLSIPAGLIIGGGAGLCAGATTGAAVGLVGGGAIGCIAAH